jgi:hypothetical protein
MAIYCPRQSTKCRWSDLAGATITDLDAQPTRIMAWGRPSDFS